MEQRLLTKEDVMKRWQISLSTVNTYIADGILVPIKELKAVRFNPRYIEEIEGTIPEPISWEEKKLQKENDLLREKISKLEKTIADIMQLCTHMR